MKHILLVTALFCLGVGLCSASDSSRVRLPVSKVQNLRGTAIKTSDIIADTGLYIVAFWATWCKPCIQELNTYADLYERWKEEYGVRIIAVSVDDARTVAKVAPYVKGRNWPFEVVLDANSDFRRAMNVNNCPHTFIVKDGAMIWQHPAFAPGDEEYVEQQLRFATGQQGAK